MQIITDQNPLPLPRAEEIEQFLSQHNATGFALFCWNTDEAKSFSAMQANLPVYAACEGIYAEDTGDLARMVISRWCRRDAAIKQAEKERQRKARELAEQEQGNRCVNFADTTKEFHTGSVKMKEAA